MFIVSISFAQYTPMTAAGYQFKRILCDSTLHIPSFCGIPTLRNSSAKNGAIAMDTCNNKLYKWTRAAGWSEISGGGGGSTGTLQTVTDSGNTTTNNIQLLNDARLILGDTGEILLNNGSKLRMGAIDALTGGSKGIAQVCAVGYEMKWEGGSLYIMNDQGFTVREVRYKFNSIPSATDDGSRGFYPGSRWVLDNGNLYVCSDSTTGAAVWQLSTIATPTLQEVTTAGSTTDLTFTGYGFSNLFQTDYNAFDNTPGYIYYPLKYSTLENSFGSGYIKAFDENTNAITPEIKFKQLQGFTLNPLQLSWDFTTGSSIKLLPIEISEPTANYELRLPVYDNGITPKDTLATLRDVRDGGGGGGSTPTGYYGAFQDNTTQTAVSANTAYPVKFNTTDLTNGVSVVNDGSSNPTRVTLANTGIYNIQFSLQLEKTGGSGNMITDIWIRKNGVDIPSTTGKVVLTGSANASPVVAAWNYVLDLAAGDYVQLMWSTNNTNVEIVAAGATSPHPAIPSSILTVTQQSGIMAGTGITAINSLTGAAQTMVTGTDSTDFKIVSTGTSHTFNLPTASASNRGALSSTDWSTFNGKIGASDTSVFQRKSISANTIMANNTASLANVTAQAFYDVAEQAMGNTITWTGTAPTSLTSANYAWQQIGKTVNMQFNALYANAGASNTGYFFTLPSDMPAPLVPTGWTGASAYLYTGSASTHNTSATINSNVAISYIRRNAANTAFEVGFIGTGVSARGFKINITYKAQ